MTTPSTSLFQEARSPLTKLAARVNERNIPFLITSIGMIVMLLWAGSYKMTAPGAEGIVPLVSNSALISWQFKVFGPYVGSDIIGLTEWTAAILMIVVFFKPKAFLVSFLVRDSWAVARRLRCTKTSLSQSAFLVVKY
jgi:uncharacterized membrane protein YkgB